MILITCAILALLCSAFMCLLIPLSWWFILPLWIGLFLGFNFLYFLVMLLIGGLLGTKKYPEKDSKFWRKRTLRLNEWILNLCNVHITIDGKDKIPDEPVVIVSNHRSNFDPMVALQVLRNRRISYISKESNLKIPVCGPLIRRCSFLPIDRSNPRSALRTLKKGSLLIKEQGLDIGIYPEGTRTYRGAPLPFKEGAFLMAKWAECPIVLLATEGTEKISSQAVFHRSNIQLSVVDVISKEQVKEMTLNEITEYAQNKLFEKLHVELPLEAYEIEKVPGVKNIPNDTI